MKKFEHELESLRDRVVEMGHLAQSMLEMSISAMTDLKPVYEKVLESEARLDQFQLDIDHEAVRLLTVYSPVAGDLRFVLAVSHVNTALERIGDQAVGLCHAIDSAGEQADPALLPKLQRMGSIAREMLRDALLAFLGKDPALARATMERDDQIDKLNDLILNEMLSEDPASRPPGTASRAVRSALTHILLARTLERMGDQATNICEEVVFMVRGEDIRHSHKQQ